jgi:hypothetical protein
MLPRIAMSCCFSIMSMVSDPITLNVGDQDYKSQDQEDRPIFLTS